MRLADHGLMSGGNAVSGDGFLNQRERDVQILVVDDDSFESRRLAVDLSTLGCTVSVRSRLQAVRETVGQIPLNFAAVNPMLDRASWYHFLRAVAPLIRRIPWVIVTDAPSCALAVEALKLGACDVLDKTVTASELLLACRGAAAAARATRTEDLSLAQVEWEHINKVIRLSNGNISEAARKLGMPRQTLYNRMHKPPASRRA